MGEHRPRVRLAPGTRLSERGDGRWQLGLHADRRLVLAAEATDHLLLARLRTGVDPLRVSVPQRELLVRIGSAGLLVPCDPPPASGAVSVDAPGDTRAAVVAALSRAGLAVTEAAGALALVVTTGAEVRRDRLDPLVRDDLPHLLLTAVAGRVRLGPLVVPGVTSCLRCVDEHLTDRDPRHPLVVHHHLERAVDDRTTPGDLALGLAWAARDARSWLTGGRPTTWAATVELTETGPVTQTWSRHPRCGCAWGEALLA
ncbi:hypothetical protein [Nocardioides aestuarii]|uniref:TOMM leader peptide-binding protein n=1 Tax=Nocardioides aestuarii TaxID=252231 RepID=A0ABW4TRB7_9ACTN